MERLPATFTTYGNPPAPTVVGGGATDNFLRLATTVNGQLNTVAFDRPLVGTTTSFQLNFSFRMGGGGITGGADGFSASFVPTALYGATGSAAPLSEEPNLPGTLGVGFDTWDNGDLNGNHVSLHWDGSTLKEFDVTGLLNLEDNAWHQASIGVDFFASTIDLTLDGSPVFTEPLSGLTPYEFRPVFGARTGGANNNHDLDNIVLTIADVPELHESSLLGSLGLLGFVAWRQHRRRS